MFNNGILNQICFDHTNLFSQSYHTLIWMNTSWEPWHWDGEAWEGQVLPQSCERPALDAFSTFSTRVVTLPLAFSPPGFSSPFSFSSASLSRLHWLGRACCRGPGEPGAPSLPHDHQPLSPQKNYQSLFDCDRALSQQGCQSRPHWAARARGSQTEQGSHQTGILTHLLPGLMTPWGRWM